MCLDSSASRVLRGVSQRLGGRKVNGSQSSDGQGKMEITLMSFELFPEFIDRGLLFYPLNATKSVFPLASPYNHALLSILFLVDVDGGPRPT